MWCDTCTTRDCIGNTVIILGLLYMIYALYLAAVKGPVLEPYF